MRRCKKITLAWVSLLFLISFSGEARGALIYDNGAITKENFAGGVGLNKSRIIFDDFTLTTPAQITGVRFWIWKHTGFDASQPYDWQIQEDSDGWPAGYPGAPASLPVASGSIAQSSVKKTLAFEISRYTEVFENEFVFESPVNMGAGKYWFGLHLNQEIPFPQNYYLWAFYYAPNMSGYKFCIKIDDGYKWGGFGNDLGFQLYGHPVSEPATLLLLLSGLLAAFGYGKKRLP